MWGQDLEAGSRVGPILFIGADQEGFLEQACSRLHRALRCQRPGTAMGSQVAVEGHFLLLFRGGLWPWSEVCKSGLAFTDERPRSIC